MANLFSDEWMAEQHQARERQARIDTAAAAEVIAAAVLWFESYMRSTLKARIEEDEFRLRDAVATLLEYKRG